MKRPGFIKRLLATRRCFRKARGSWTPRPSLPPGAPKVSIMLVTYNHARYIGQALDGILMQERDFDIEINVIDDASTDGTQEIVREYQRRHPDIVRCLFNAANVGHIATQLNTYRGFQTLRGQYFALLEGDDYWSHPAKLRTQVAFLDTHPEYVACAHDTLKVYEDGSRPPEHFLPFKAFGRTRATMSDLIGLAGVFHLSSLLYRNVFGAHPPQCLSDRFSCEATINMVYGQFGDFRHLPGYMSVYRVHGSGVFSGQSLERMWLFHLHGFRRFALYLGSRYAYDFLRAVSGFSSYVLGAHRRSEVRLQRRTRAIFLVHLAVAKPVYLVLHAVRCAWLAAVAVRYAVSELNRGRDARGRSSGRPEDFPGLAVRVVRTQGVLRAARERRQARAAAPHTSGPRVSVVLLAHNHAATIAHALDSVLAQRRDFSIEINVVDAASTDGTQALACDYRRRYPHLIHCHFRAAGEGYSSWQLSLWRALRTARGTYVALLDGGDYWSDPDKLARQVAFLDTHPGHAGCGHDMLELPARAAISSAMPDRHHPGRSVTIGTSELLEQSVVLHLSSLVLRNVFAGDPPPCLADPYASEATMSAVYSRFGPLHRFPARMAVRRAQPAGVQRTDLQLHQWRFQLRGLQRLVLYLGPNGLHPVARAIATFSRHVLQSAQARRIGLPLRMRLSLLANLACARLLALCTRPGEGFERLRRRTRLRLRARLAARGHVPGSRFTPYRLLVLVAPHWLLRGVVRIEVRWPALRALRRRRRYPQEIQFHP